MTLWGPCEGGWDRDTVPRPRPRDSRPCTMHMSLSYMYTRVLALHVHSRPCTMLPYMNTRVLAQCTCPCRCRVLTQGFNKVLAWIAHTQYISWKESPSLNNPCKLQIHSKKTQICMSCFIIARTRELVIQRGSKMLTGPWNLHGKKWTLDIWPCNHTMDHGPCNQTLDHGPCCQTLELLISWWKIS